jgi:hypothetical protein
MINLSPDELAEARRSAPQPATSIPSRAGGLSPAELAQAKSSMPPSLLKEMGKGIAALGLGGAQAGVEGAEGLQQLLASSLAPPKDLPPSAQALFGQKREPVKSDIFGTTGKKLNPLLEEIGEGAGRGLTAASLVPVGGEAAFIPKAIGYFASAAATQPGGMRDRAIAGSIAAAFPGMAKVIKRMPAATFKSQLAKLIENTHSGIKDTAKSMYNAAFEGTGGTKVQISPETYKKLDELGKLSYPIRKAITTFNNDMSPNALHILKSDLNKEAMRLGGQKVSKGYERNIVTRILGREGHPEEGVTDSISRDLETHMSKLNPEKYNQYRSAQDYYRENVVPFKEYKSLRDLLGPGRKVKKSLYRDLGEDATPAGKLRDLLDISRPTLAAGSLLHSNYVRALSALSGLGALGFHHATGLHSEGGGEK